MASHYYTILGRILYNIKGGWQTVVHTLAACFHSFTRTQAHCGLFALHVVQTLYVHELHSFLSIYCRLPGNMGQGEHAEAPVMANKGSSLALSYWLNPNKDKKRECFY